MGYVRPVATPGTKGAVRGNNVNIFTTKTGTKMAHVQRGVNRPVGKVKTKTSKAGPSTAVMALARSWKSGGGCAVTKNPPRSAVPHITSSSETNRPIHSWDLRQKIRRPTTR